MVELLKLMNGYKTYLTAGAAILTAIVAFLNNGMTATELIVAIFTAIQTANIRHAITTTVSDATNKKL